MDGEHNGAFTEQPLKVWNHGTFQGNYQSFHSRIRAGLPRHSIPNLFVPGDAVLSSSTVLHRLTQQTAADNSTGHVL